MLSPFQFLKAICGITYNFISYAQLSSSVTSANLTYGGIKSNFEYGVLIDDLESIKIIK
jgi:hypothetical protein